MIFKKNISPVSTTLATTATPTLLASPTSPFSASITNEENMNDFVDDFINDYLNNALKTNDLLNEDCQHRVD